MEEITEEIYGHFLKQNPDIKTLVWLTNFNLILILVMYFSYYAAYQAGMVTHIKGVYLQIDNSALNYNTQQHCLV